MSRRTGAFESVVIAIVGGAIAASVGCGPDGPNIADSGGGGGGGDTGRVVDAGGDVVSDAGGDAGSDAGGDASGGKVGEVDTEFEEAKPIRTLSKAQQRKICRAGEDYTQSNLTWSEACRWWAHTRAASPDYDNDQAAVDACKTEREKWEENAEPDSHGCKEIAGASECNATVGQWEACEQALAEEFIRYVDGLPACSETTADYYKEKYERYPPRSRDLEALPESCRPIRSSCPNFYKSWVGPIKNPS